MTDRPTAGFTLVEVILFLALTALFMLIAFTGISGRSGRVQFTDSMRSLASFLQRQYSDTLNGVNTRTASGCSYGASGYTNATASSPGRSQCTILGKAMVFTAGSDTADVYVIVGRFLTQTVDSTDPDYLDPSRSDEQLINDAEPVVLTTELKEDYSMEWQTTFVETASAPRGIAFIRSPRSTSIYPITFTPPNWGSDPSFAFAVSGLTEHAANYCFRGNNGQDAEVIIGGDSQADAVQLAFDTGCS